MTPSVLPANWVPTNLVRFHLPAQASVRGGNVAGQGHEHGNGVLGGADGVAARRVHDDDAAPRRRRHVDVIDADAGTHDRPQFARLFEQVRGERRAAADDDAVRRLQRFLERGEILAQSGPVIDFEACLLEQVNAEGFEFVADEDTWHDSHFLGQG